LNIAGYADEAAQRVIKMLADITDEEIQRARPWPARRMV